MDYKADVIFLSETWMSSDDDDITAVIKTYGYKLLHNRRRNREKRIGGGVGVMLKVTLESKKVSSKQFSSFEHTIVIIDGILPNDVKLSDHFLLEFKVSISALKKEYISLNYRDTKSVDSDRFCSDIKNGYTDIHSGNMKEKMIAYNTLMSGVVDSHAPLKTKQIKIVPNAPWFDFEYKSLRRLRRKAEKRYKQSGLEVHKKQFITLRKQTTVLAFNKKRTYYAERIDACNGNSKSLFSCVNKLLDIKQDVVLPSHNSNTELAENFKLYFKEKISNIRKTFPTSDIRSNNETILDSMKALYTFEPTTEDELRSVILTCGINCSPEDPVPISLLKNNLDLFIPIWRDIVNLSLSQGSMDCLKNAILNPLIKELDSLLDIDALNNYRPVSNLVFLSKLIERIVASRIESHMVKHDLQSSKQYGYKKGHSSEMLLVKIVNDLLTSCDRKTPTLLMLLDLSAAFDTVDQNKLLKILHDEIGIRGTAFTWFTSFLKSRTQRVKIGNSYSSVDILEYGVPQGSVLGPVLFNIYTRSFYSYVQSVGFEVEGFADDHQLRRPFNPAFQVKALGENIEKCLQAITLWMNEFFLRLNSSKTKILVVCSPTVKSKLHINGTFINGKCIRFVHSAKNLGVILDTELSFEAQIRKVTSSCFSTIRNISRIKGFLNSDQIKTLVSTLVFTKLDYCNVLYYGLNSHLLSKLQTVQNSALRLVHKMQRYDRLSISKIFNDLHWLKIKERITFKVLLIMHKCVIGTAPHDVKGLITPSNSDRTKKVDIPTSMGKYGDRAFSVAGPKLWNALPFCIREEMNTLKFKKSLKTFLFDNSESFHQHINMK